MTRIRWKRLDRPGFEDFELLPASPGWMLRGHVQVEEATIDYTVLADDRWRTRRAEITVGTQAFRVTVDEKQRWIGEDGTEIQNLRGCIDVDMAFTPSTNTLPIRRLALKIGESAPARAAWFRFPELRWDLLDQQYERVAERTWVYGSKNFRTQLSVDSEGIVHDYAGVWTAV